MIKDNLYSVYQLYLFKNYNNIDVSVTLINKLEDRLKLFFLSQEKENSVCYAHSPNLRIEYKDFFTSNDVIHYLIAFAHFPHIRDNYKPAAKNNIELLIPKDTRKFWELAEIGRLIKKNLYFENFENTSRNVHLVKNISKIESIKWEFSDKEKSLGKIWINSEDYFDNILFEIWDFSIYGFKPVQQWLHQRLHYNLSSRLTERFEKIMGSIEEINKILKQKDSLLISLF